MGLGKMTNVAQIVRAANEPQSEAWDSPSLRRRDTIPDDDSLLAEIRGLCRAEEPGIFQNPADSIAATLDQKLKRFAAHFSETLAKYKELSEEVATGTFSPTTLRNRIERLKEAVSFSVEQNQDRNSTSYSWTQEEFKSASKGAVDTRVLAWLKDEAQRAMLSQNCIEPGRVLALLR